MVDINDSSMTLNDIAIYFDKPIDEFSKRLDGRIEWSCPHGVGHTVWHPVGGSGIHGCCGCCCSKLKKKDTL